MAEIVKVIQEGRGFECQVCGVPWIPKSLKRRPKRCNNAQCRSMRWDAEKYPNAGPPRPPSGGGAFDNGKGDGEHLPRICYQTLPVPIRKPTIPASVNPEAGDALAA
jgi:hypothetical protein